MEDQKYQQSLGHTYIPVRKREVHAFLEIKHAKWVPKEKCRLIPINIQENIQAQHYLTYAKYSIKSLKCCRIDKKVKGNL